MTAPKPAAVKEARATARRLHQHLKDSKATDTETPHQLLLQVLALARTRGDHAEAAIDHLYPPGTAEAVLARGVCVALGTAELTASPTRNRIVSRVRVLDTAIHALHRDLVDDDRVRARRQARVNEEGNAHIALRLLAHTAELRRRYEAMNDWQLPVTKAEWAQFTGEVARDLLDLKLEWKVVAPLLLGPTYDTESGERLRQRTVRAKRRRTPPSVL